jgi:adenylate cyclase class 2
MLEIELKYRVADFQAAESWIQRVGLAPWIAREDRDRYFNHPGRDFAVTDEALRIRSIGCTNCITYKGPRIDTQTKTREEIELPIADGPDAVADLERMLLRLGFRAVATVSKSRRVAQVARDGFEIHICLDAVEHVGQYVELEIVAESGHLNEAKAILFQIAKEIGLQEPERRSYLELLLARR